MMNGTMFEACARNGFNLLKEREQVINDLNVFPVSDGDTGTNMSLTLGNGLKYAESTENLGEYIKKLSRGMLLGARGNSGVIFSQIIKGMSMALQGHEAADTILMAEALTKGYETAYAAVKHPAEGTILTVAREGIEKIRAVITADMTCGHLFKKYLASMQTTLARTPELLPVLKEAGVVDSGGMGLIAFFEGFVSPEEMSGCRESQRPDRICLPGQSADGEHGFRTEFVLHPNTRFFSIEELTAFLESKGSSIVTSQDGDVIKVHLHCEDPMTILNFVNAFGTFYSIKVDNLDAICRQQEQRVNQLTKAKIQKKGIAYVAVAQGDGVIDILQELGCDIVINGGQTMNTSAEEFAEAFSLLPAEHIVVLPNDANVLLAAKQGAELSNRGNIHILETRSVVEGYFAMSMRVGDDHDVNEQLHVMRQGFENVRTLMTARATVSRTIGGVSCKENDVIALVDKNMIAAGEETAAVVLDALSHVEDLDSYGTALIFRGQQMDEDECQEIADAIMERYDTLSCGILFGGQDVYDLIIGITE